MSCYRCGEHQETRPYGPGGALVCIWCATSTAKDESATRAAFGARLTNSPQVLTEAGPQCGIALGVLRRVVPRRGKT
jgi:hypothetical protein